ncbi:MAG: hypothetical protein ACKVS7_04320 [Gemmatimonadaceae bacterium]
MRAIRLLVLCATIACAGTESGSKAERDTALGLAIDSVPSADGLEGAGAVLTFGRVLPADESMRDASLQAFRDTLLAIVAARDTSRLLALLDSNIKSSFGGDDGLDGFRAHWELAKGETRVWAVLQDVLSHGGTFEGPDMFVAPYSFGAFPDTLDAFSLLVVRRPAVRAYARADSMSRVVGILAYQLVRVADTVPPEPWVGIALRGDSVGFVRSEFVRSPIDYRITIARENGRWRVIYFLAGD